MYCALFNYGIMPIGNLVNYSNGKGEGINTIKKKDSVEENIDSLLKARGLNLDGSEGDTIDTSGYFSTIKSPSPPVSGLFGTNTL